LIFVTYFYIKDESKKLLIYQNRKQLSKWTRTI